MTKIDNMLERFLGIRRSKNPMPPLGPRELEVLKLLWREQPLTAQCIHQRSQSQDISLSTVQSTLERLYRKQLIEREKSGRSYVYTAAINQSTVISRLLQDLAIEISDGDMAPMISGFMDFISEEVPDADTSGLKAMMPADNNSRQATDNSGLKQSSD